MPTPEFERRTSYEPGLAPAGWEHMDPCQLVRDTGDWHTNTWAGYGFLIADLIQGVWWYDEARQCGHCGSNKTRCIYLENDVHQFSTGVRLELRCLRCGGFTQYLGSD